LNNQPLLIWILKLNRHARNAGDLLSVLNARLKTPVRRQRALLGVAL
jgi:hypothetical protein